MAICCFGIDDKFYTCEYEVTNDAINIDVDYDIAIETEPINNVIIFNTQTDYKVRDILIIDKQYKTSYLAKKSVYISSKRVFNSFYSDSITHFKSFAFFTHKNLDILRTIPSVPKITAMKIFSKNLISDTDNPLTIIDNKKALTYSLKKEKTERTITIGEKNIESISISSVFQSTSNKHHLEIDIDSYLKITFVNAVKDDCIREYINELTLYMQLYKPNNFKLSKILVQINENWIQYSCPLFEYTYKEKNVIPTVNEDLLSYLACAYKNIPYHEGHQFAKNIPFILTNTSKPIEDQFLSYYRFIESYRKTNNSSGHSYTFLNKILTERKDLIKKNENEISDLTQEIISLRNHYVHTGFFIKNKSLEIKFPKRVQNRTYKTTVDINWIYLRTKLLFNISIDIIFKEILKYPTYNFHEHV